MAWSLVEELFLLLTLFEMFQHALDMIRLNCFAMQQLLKTMEFYNKNAGKLDLLHKLWYNASLRTKLLKTKIPSCLVKIFSPKSTVSDNIHTLVIVYWLKGSKTICYCKSLN